MQLHYVTICDLTSKKFAMYHMAGGFDGMEVTAAGTRRGSPKSQTSVMEVKKKESTQGVDNLYKFLKIKYFLLWIY